MSEIKTIEEYVLKRLVDAELKAQEYELRYDFWQGLIRKYGLNLDQKELEAILFEASKVGLI